MLRDRRWPQSYFQTSTPLLFQNVWIRIRNFFELVNPAPATTDATEIQQRFHLRNDIHKDHADSCYCRKLQVTPGTGFHKFSTRAPGPKEKCRILHPGYKAYCDFLQSQQKFSPETRVMRWFFKFHFKGVLPKGEEVVHSWIMFLYGVWKQSFAATANFLAVDMHYHCIQYFLSGGTTLHTSSLVKEVPGQWKGIECYTSWNC